MSNIMHKYLFVAHHMNISFGATEVNGKEQKTNSHTEEEKKHDEKRKRKKKPNQPICLHM